MTWLNFVLNIWRKRSEEGVRDHRKANPEAFEIKAEVPVEKPITESMGAMDALIESQLKNPQRLNISNAITEEPSTRKWWRRLKSFWSDN